MEIDCSRRLLLPGLVNIHTHPTSEPLRKGITDETRSPGFWHSSLYEFLTVFNNDREGSVAAMRVALAELLMSGVTTVVDISPRLRRLDRYAGRVRHPRRRRADVPRCALVHEERPPARVRLGQRRRAARASTTRAASSTSPTQHPSGRLSGMMMPAQIDTCSPELIRDAYDYAVERRLPLQIHASQSVTEFHEMFRRHGKTPIALAALGSARSAAIPSSATASSSTITPGCTGRRAATCPCCATPAPPSPTAPRCSCAAASP